MKVVLFDSDSGTVLARTLADQGIDQNSLALELLDTACHQARIPRPAVASIIATGYGRKAVKQAHSAVTEISCHAAGVYFLDPDVRTIVEIGGQDCKVICVESRGRVRDFAMNDRCAAGSGRFLEIVAQRLRVDVGALGQFSSEGERHVQISSMCVVFAETEVIGLLAQGVPVPEIVAGVQDAIAARVASLASPLMAGPACFTGGVALQKGMVRALESALSCQFKIPEWPQFTGALGASILAARANPEQRFF